MVYLLNKCEYLHDNLKELYQKESLSTNNNTIPFWLILLRLHNNINNVYVEYKQENNYLSKHISDEETKYLQNKILKFLRTNQKIHSIWLNLCLKHLSINFLNSNKFRQIYEFILS